MCHGSRSENRHGGPARVPAANCARPPRGLKKHIAAFKVRSGCPWTLSTWAAEHVSRAFTLRVLVETLWRTRQARRRRCRSRFPLRIRPIESCAQDVGRTVGLRGRGSRRSVQTAPRCEEREFVTRFIGVDLTVSIRNSLTWQNRPADGRRWSVALVHFAWLYRAHHVALVPACPC